MKHAADRGDTQPAQPDAIKDARPAMPHDPKLSYLDHARRARELRSHAFRKAMRRLIARLKR